LKKGEKQKMGITRRDFLKVSTATTGAVITGLFNIKSVDAKAENLRLRIRYAKQVTTICPYCGVGCGQICSVSNGKVINIEGDSDNPINKGSLCSKGSALYQLTNNERRLSKVKYRAPNSNKWEEVSWDWALNRMARKIKDTRDKTFQSKDRAGRIVNRTESIGWLGSAAIDNEECYLAVKLARSLGIVFLEHQARLCHSSTVAALAESFGRGAMTNHWIDIRNSDCIFIIGSNAAENHPVAFKYVTEAMEKGAKLISADPRFTRTSSKADIYAPFRSGTDVALIGGIINYCIKNKLYNKEYVAEYTNASFLVDPKFKFRDGLFSGYSKGKRKYNKGTWKYQTDEKGVPLEDKTLKHPRCVFQLMRKHYSRYNPDTVNKVTGTPKDVFLKIAKTYCATGKPGKAGTIMYAMGTTQHTNAAQMIRSYAIMQLLLGNIGVAGGGVNALRGWSNVQGATDHCVLFHILPGYLKTPRPENTSLSAYLAKWTPKSSDPKSVNYWKFTPRFMVSQLKAFYGDKATKANGFCYDHLPKLSGNCSHISMFEAMYDGKMKGLFCLGQNPAVAGPNARMERKAMEKLDWLISIDIFENETAAFWKGPEANPSDIKTEVFLLPAACSVEREGSVTNSGRWSQWRYKAGPTPGEAKRDLWIIDRIFRAVRGLYSYEGGAYPKGILDMAWDYGDEPNVHKVAKEINGYNIITGKLLPSFGKLKDDGTTSSGNWLYCGSYTEKGNMAARRGLSDPTGIGLYPEWSWCWPVNRRIIYNRASCDTKGKPWDSEHPVIKWTGTKWVGDVPDYGKTAAPGKNIGAFIMKPEGHARLFGMGLADGPFPEHYEPVESPVKNLLSKTQNDPAIKIWKGEMDKLGTSKEFPIIATTFRLTEHHQGGPMTRNLPWLAELMPDMFVEMSKSLAKEKGIKNGDKVKIASARGEIEAVACVTDRFKPFKLNGKTHEQIGLPWHWGFIGLVTGDSANCLTPHVGDANTMIPEYKAFLCNVKKKGVA
jgi:formate dehydrogenase major subunit